MPVLPPKIVTHVNFMLTTVVIHKNILAEQKLQQHLGALLVTPISTRSTHQIQGRSLRSEPFFSYPGDFSRITLGFPRDITPAWERDADPLTYVCFNGIFLCF